MGSSTFLNNCPANTDTSSSTYPGYTGFSPATSPATIQRQWPDYNPIMSVSDAKMTCNGGTSAALTANIAAGQNITAIWSQWTHKQGPVMVWMYKCSGAFSACDGKGKSWFKIDQMGMYAPPLSGDSWGTAIVVDVSDGSLHRPPIRKLLVADSIFSYV